MTRSIFRWRPLVEEPNSYHVTLGHGDLFRLGRQGHLALRVEIWCKASRLDRDREPWRIVVHGYIFDLAEPQRGVRIGYHWHRTGPSSVSTPHLHVSAQGAASDLGKAHLPTGQISVVDVIRCAITEFGVRPLRLDWREVLDRAEGALTDPISV